MPALAANTTGMLTADYANLRGSDKSTFCSASIR